LSPLNRREMIVAAAASGLVPTAASAGECLRPGMNWETMSLEQRNLAYNNVAKVGVDYAKKKAEEWAAASKALRQTRSQHLDIAYGPKERNKWDLYPAGNTNAPCMIHIHGGYWQRGSKEQFACLAEGALARGWSAALPGYTLAPEANLTQIATELQTALDWFDQKRAEYGISGKVYLTGWSAGGCMTGLLSGHPMVAAAVAISGIYDLAGLRDSPHVNDALKFTEIEVQSLSPMRLPPAEKPVSITYGSDELPFMIASSRDYHAYRAERHLPGDLVPVPHGNHMTMLDELRKENGYVMRTVANLAT
jgi:arylformamidase